jgi:hypothetical protein
MEGYFRISNSGQVSEQLRAAFAQADQVGALPVTVRAARWIVEEMERTPDEFGESRDYLPEAGIRMRIAFAPPLYVIFGIHEDSRTVFVRKIGWLERA